MQMHLQFLVTTSADLAEEVSVKVEEATWQICREKKLRQNRLKGSVQSMWLKDMDEASRSSTILHRNIWKS